MTVEQGGLLPQLREISPAVSSVLIAGENNVDCEMMALYIHESVLGLSRSSQQKLYCFSGAEINDEMQSILAQFPACPEPYSGMQHTLIIHDVDDLHPSQQIRLLQLLRTKLNQSLRHIRFILLENTLQNNLITEMHHYFKHHAYYVSPLMSRPSDILPLAEFIIKKSSVADGEPVPSLSLDAQAYIKGQDWWQGCADLVQEISFALYRYEFAKQSQPELTKLSKTHFTTVELKVSSHDDASVAV
jgi:hypothetical protein